jgi:hypothetical protein
MISKEAIFQATEGGKAVIIRFYPQSSSCFAAGGRKNFKIRPDDKTPSCTVFQKEGVWFIQDKGGSDTKAYTAIQLVMKEQNLKYGQAIQWIAQNFAPDLCQEGSSGPSLKPEPRREKAEPQEKITVIKRKGGKFTEKELAILGYKISPESCSDLCLIPLEGYVTARNAKGQSWKILSTEDYPIFYYDYGKWGKIYQPLGDIRFMYVGEKPAEFIFGERDFLEAYAQAKKGIYPGKVKADPEDEFSQDVDMTWPELIICSGGSDALNVHNAGYRVCWLNSETADLTEYEFGLLQKIAKKIYILYDIDETGKANALKIALQYLDISIITLPSELARFRTRSGKPCKDAKDFFVHFRRPENQNPVSLFKELVKLSGGLKFWMEKYSKTGAFQGYDINNEQLYSFLEASGYHKIATSATAKGYTFCHIRDNVVTLIDEQAISAHCSAYLLEYIKTHPGYYTQALANSIHRSNQVRLSSLEKLAIVEPDFNSFTVDADYFFFRNCIIRVTAAGLEKVKPSDCRYMVYSNKIIDFDFAPEEPYFDVEYTKDYAAKLMSLKALQASYPLSPNIVTLRKQIDAIEDTRRYLLKILRHDCTFMQFVYDTGRLYWRKEELGYQLSESEEAETQLNFISKVMALGYLLTKEKNAGQPYAIYAMEMEQSEEGTHLGGTGKSLFISSIEQLRRQLFINGQDLRPEKTDFLLQGVVKGVTDNVFFDDLNELINLHRFMPMITGKMVVNAKYAPAFVLDFKESPKVAFTSNHAIKSFDASLRRRTWFAAFSDYYHSDDPQRNLVERSPLTKFGKNLIQDYSKEEMNHFYNFMLNCIVLWKKLRVRIQPPMKLIEQRNLQRAMTDEFMFWCEDYFTERRLDCLVNKHEAFEAYKATLSKKIADVIKINTFKSKLMLFCAYKEWTFNPECLLLTESERKRNDIRKKSGNEDLYYFYIDTKNSGEDLPVNEILSSVPSGGEGEDRQQNMWEEDDDKPPFAD